MLKKITKEYEDGQSQREAKLTQEIGQITGAVCKHVPGHAWGWFHVSVSLGRYRHASLFPPGISIASRAACSAMS